MKKKNRGDTETRDFLTTNFYSKMTVKHEVLADPEYSVEEEYAPIPWDASCRQHDTENIFVIGTMQEE